MSSLIARRWFEEVWNQRNIEVVRELAAPKTLAHHEWGDCRDLDSFKLMHVEFLSAMPDLRFDVEDVVEDGKGNVVTRWVMKGCHTGKGIGCPPTGQKVFVRGMTWMVVKDGRIVEGWDSFNFDGLMGTLAGKPRASR